MRPQVLEAISIARRLNPHIKILARCAFTSGGLQAAQRGADEVIVAEQAVAREFSHLISKHIPQSHRESRPRMHTNPHE